MVQEAMKAVLDFEGYSMLGVVPEAEYVDARAVPPWLAPNSRMTACRA